MREEKRMEDEGVTEEAKERRGKQCGDTSKVNC